MRMLLGTDWLDFLEEKVVFPFQSSAIVPGRWHLPTRLELESIWLIKCTFCEHCIVDGSV